MELQRREVLYSGDVQGVGFRYTARQIAGGHAVSGYVRNMPDGRVQLVVEGAAEAVDSFLDELAETMEGYIRRAAVEVLSATGEFRGFGIRY